MKRVYFYDNIKGLLILCVLLIHTLGICSNHYGYNYDFFKLLSFFIIPLFMFTTGVFARKSKKKPISKAIKLLIIYIIFQILITLYYKYVNIISPKASILTPRFTLWYIFTISFYYLSVYILRKSNYKIVLITSLILGILSGFIKQITDVFSMARMINWFIFFALGYYEDKINIIKNCKKHKKAICLLTFLTSIWFLFNMNFFLFKDTYLKYNYYTYQTLLKCFYKRCLLYPIFFLYSSFILLINKNKKTFLSSLGNKTLIIYLLHGAILKTISHYGLFLKNPIIGTFTTFLITFIISFLISLLVTKIKQVKKN